MEEDKSTIIEALGLLCMSLLMIALNVFVVYQLWEWLVVPIFHAQHINLKIAYALCVLLMVLKNKRVKSDEDADYQKQMIDHIKSVASLLFFGYTAHLLIS